MVKQILSRFDFTVFSAPTNGNVAVTVSLAINPSTGAGAVSIKVPNKAIDLMGGDEADTQIIEGIRKAFKEAKQEARRIREENGFDPTQPELPFGDEEE